MIRDLGVVDLSEDDVARVLALAETHYLDLKDKRLTPADLSVHASAFANSAGGEIYLGLQERRHRAAVWSGFATVEDANAHIQILDKTFEGADVASAEFLRAKDETGFVLRIVIEKSNQIFTATDGKVYKRVGAQKLPVALTSHDEHERLRLDKGAASYEDTLLRDVDLERVTNSVAVIGFMIHAVPISEPIPWLTSQRLLVEENPTVAACLLFDDEPQAILPKRSAIKILRYEESSEEGHRDQMVGDPLTIEGCLYDQIHEAVSTIIDIVEANRVQRAEGLVSIEYPQETLHEIVTNAVLHRDYSIVADVQVRIFDNRIEVESPGKLAGHVTTENILHVQFARNGKLVRLINKFPNPPNKDVGEGLNTASQKMHEIGLKPPEVTEDESSVTVYIRHERLASHEEQILDYLTDHGEINNSKARDLTGEGSENRMKRVFERLMLSGDIHRDPTRKGRATAYLPGPKPPDDDPSD